MYKNIKAALRKLLIKPCEKVSFCMCHLLKIETG